MLSNITMGQYYPVDSFVHRLDPRAPRIKPLRHLQRYTPDRDPEIKKMNFLIGHFLLINLCLILLKIN